ncbi:MAG TPA: NUDIX hydrolase [Myxococcaceae bacterium]|nr:NUDIX hydrolase [Myxococcaceae bacterium]
MSKEVSAGGVVVRERGGVLEVAVIRPRGRNLWALPKGHIDEGESLEQTARREVKEETGLDTTLEKPLGEIHYTYQWRGKSVAKRVHFFLFRYAAGEIDELDPQMRHEVEKARWMPLADAPRDLGYEGEREVASRALETLKCT